MLHCEKLYKNLLVLASSCEKSLCLSLTDRKLRSFTCRRLLENIIANLNIMASKQAHLRMKNVSRMIEKTKNYLSKP